MILFHNTNEDQGLNQDNDTSTDSLNLLLNGNSSSISTHFIKKSNQRQCHQKKKTTPFGIKDRSSALYRYMLEKQKDNTVKVDKNYCVSFTQEEDKFLVLLVKQLGPKFSKITKYFPGKTLNMIKNRYYKKLKTPAAQRIPENVQKQLGVQEKKQRVMGKQMITLWPEEERMASVIENSDLFPEAKVQIQNLFSAFSSIIGNCMKHI